VPVPLYKPQLAQLVKEPPAGAEWLHEMKYDGYRIGCRIVHGRVNLISRNGKDWTNEFPDVCEAARGLGVRDALLDGEVAIVLPDGRTSFQDLQNAFTGGSRRGLVYFAFDLLHAGGETFVKRPLIERKKELLRLVGKPRARSRIRYSEHVVGQGATVFAEACRLHLEGIVSKRADSEYRPGRHGGWVKTKCILRQEFVVGGFTDPEGSRQGIGALLVGYFDEGRLVFAGKVGTGFTVAVARDLRKRLEAIEQAHAAFDPRPAGWLGNHAHWVQPTLVAEVTFTEWTGDGKIRHPSFQGLRRDKAASAVRREDAAALPVPATASRAKAAPSPRPARTPIAQGRATIAGVSISHPDRIMFPDARLTKADVALFYERISEWMLPHVQGRPLTLVRCPQGLSEDCFFMKHSKVWAPAALRRVSIQEKKKIGDYLVADTTAALVSLVQMDVLEIHTWNTRVDNIEQPDRIVFDIDPGSDVPWKQVIESAHLVRRLLETVDLESFPKTTGGAGLHVVVPILPRTDWSKCLEFSRALAEAIERHEPTRYTTAFAKAGRERKILVDYLRNNRTNTSVAAFSTRARAGAPVSMPIRWDELTAALKPSSWNVRTAERRLSSLRVDPWKDYWTTKQRLSGHAVKALNHLAV
jgi:bifunctional non-homologous end joining protein LigD